MRYRMHSVMIAEHLALGTAQLGGNSAYAKMPPTETECERILRTAYYEGIRYFDTAQAYGLSEERVGRYVPNDAKIITKLHPDACDESLEKIEERLLHSLAVLRRNHIWGLLLHRERMLDRWQAGLGELLFGWQDRGLISCLGLSLESSRSDAMVFSSAPGMALLQVPADISQPVPPASLFVRSVYAHGMVKDRRAAIARTHERFGNSDVTLLIGAETAEQVRANCRMVRDEYRVRVG